jgi:hypothetical protein
VGGKKMVRKVVIEMILIPESTNRRPREIEHEILEEIRHGHLIVPWCGEAEKVTVIE